MPQKPAGKVFLSYRLGEVSAVAEQLHHLLEEVFGKTVQFTDAHDIPASTDIMHGTEERVAECKVLLALISETWLDAPDGKGGRLLDSPDDTVHIAIASALRLGKVIIAVLVNGARMPGARRLPKPLKHLAYCNAVQLSHGHAAAGLEELVPILSTALTETTPYGEGGWEFEKDVRHADTSGENTSVVRLGHAGDWPTLAELHEAIEPAEWEIIADQQDVGKVRGHVGGFSGNTTSRSRNAKVEIESWRVFLSEFPDDIDIEEARAQLQTLEREAKAVWEAEAGELSETKAWERAATSGGIAEIKVFLSEWPSGEYAAAARVKLEELESKARAAWEAKARKRDETKAWESAWRSGDIAEIKAFLKEWPESEFANEAGARIKQQRGPLVTRRRVLMGVGAGGAIAVVGGGIGMMHAAKETPRESLRAFLSDHPILTFAGHKAWIHSVGFSPDGRTLLSGSGDDVLKLWDASSGTEIQSFTGFPDGVRSAAFSPDGHTILCGGGSNGLILVDADTGEVLRSFKGHGDGVPSVAFSPDGHILLSGSWDKTLRLWDVAKGAELRTFRGHTGEINAVAFSPGGKAVLSGSRDRTLRLWDIDTGHVLRTFHGHTDWIGAVVFSPSGRTVLSSSADKSLRLWDVATGRELRAFPGQARDFNPVAFTPDGLAILSGGYAKLKLWDVATGGKLGTFTGHTGGITSVAISPDGRTAVSGSTDKTLKLWEITSIPLLSSRR